MRVATGTHTRVDRRSPTRRDFVVTDIPTGQYDPGHIDEVPGTPIDGHTYSGYYWRTGTNPSVWRVVVHRDGTISQWRAADVVGHGNIVAWIRHLLDLPITDRQLQALYDSGTLTRPDPVGEQIEDLLHRMRQMEDGHPDDVVSVRLRCGCRYRYPRHVAEELELTGTHVRCEACKMRLRIESVDDAEPAAR